MNWDWDKLSEQKRRQGSPSPDPVNRGEDWGKWLPSLRGRLPGGPKIVIGLLLLIWIASGIYIVEPDEAGVVQRFGAYVATTGPGPHYHLPFPFESVKTPKVSQVRRVEVGFRSGYGRDGSAMLIGILAGTYSSIFVASPILLDFGSGLKPRAGATPVSNKSNLAKA